MTKRQDLKRELIRKLYLDGKTIEYLSKMFCCSTATTYKIVKDIVRSKSETLIGNKRCLGRKQTKIERENRSMSNKGRKKSKEERINISNGKKGKKFTLQHRMSLSIAKTGEKLFTGFKRTEADRLRHQARDTGFHQ